MFFGTAKCKVNSRRFLGGGGGEGVGGWRSYLDEKRLGGWRLLQLALCKPILNTFVYEIYQRVFILFELSVKHTLSDFLLPFCCQNHYNY